VTADLHRGERAVTIGSAKPSGSSQPEAKASGIKPYPSSRTKILAVKFAQFASLLAHY
jgi:hypothetical protein